MSACHSTARRFTLASTDPLFGALARRAARSCGAAGQGRQTRATHGPLTTAPHDFSAAGWARALLACEPGRGPSPCARYPSKWLSIAWSSSAAGVGAYDAVEVEKFSRGRAQSGAARAAAAPLRWRGCGRARGARGAPRARGAARGRRGRARAAATGRGCARAPGRRCAAAALGGARGADGPLGARGPLHQPHAHRGGRGGGALVFLLKVSVTAINGAARKQFNHFSWSGPSAAACASCAWALSKAVLGALPGSRSATASAPPRSTPAPA
jgi:hypothetical protein